MIVPPVGRPMDLVQPLGRQIVRAPKQPRSLDTTAGAVHTISSVLILNQPVHIENHLAGVQTARRALELLRLLVNSDESLGLSELSRRSGLNKATTYRLMQLFEEYSYVAREDGGRSYVTGPG